MAHLKHAHSILIDAIGSRVVRDQFRLTPQRLHMWRIRGVPHELRPAFAQLLTIHGKTVPSGFLATLEQAA